MNDLEIIKIKLENLKPFSGVLYDENNVATKIEGNPFYVPQDYLPTDDDEKEKPSEAVASLRRLHESIEAEGLLTPILVRPTKNENEYEILSGYRRKRVCEELAKTNPDFKEIPAIFIDCDDDMASSIITSSNVQRQKFSTVDKIKSCGRMYRALAHRGRRNKDKEEYTAYFVSKITGINYRTVIRYGALISLPEDMINLIGNKVKNSAGELRLCISSGVELYNIGADNLAVINNVLMENKEAVITQKQANEIKKFCKANDIITEKDVLERISLEPRKKEGKIKKFRLTLNNEKMQAYCPDMSKTEIENLIYDLLEKWQKSSS